MRDVETTLTEAVMRLRALAHAVEEAGRRVRAEASRGWRSAAGDVYAQRMRDAADQVQSCAARLTTAATAMQQHAGRCTQVRDQQARELQARDQQARELQVRQP